MDLGDIENREQQVLDRHVFMAAVIGPLKGLVQAEFELTAAIALCDNSRPLDHRRILPLCTSKDVGAHAHKR